MSPTRIAAIDIGTNTVKLLVAEVDEGRIRPLVEESATTRLGEGVAATGRLSREAIDRTAEAVKLYADKARQSGVSRILTVTTSGARSGKNSDEFLARTLEVAAVRVEIISGEREAELIFAGVNTDPDIHDRRLLVMDVGGGSAELIAGQAGKIDRRVSLPGGAVRLTERFFHTDPISEEELKALFQHARNLLQPALAEMETPGRVMIATGGTITTAAAVDQSLIRFSVEKIHHHRLTRLGLSAMLERLRRLPLAERRQVAGLPPKRADIIVAGLAMVVMAMELAQIEEVTVSTRGLRFGLMAESCGLRRQ